MVEQSCTVHARLRWISIQNVIAGRRGLHHLNCNFVGRSTDQSICIFALVNELLESAHTVLCL